MTKRIYAVWLLVGSMGTIEAFGAVSPPSGTPAKIIVSGRTSTAVDIKIVKVGQEIARAIPSGANTRSRS